eukprot:UN11731
MFIEVAKESAGVPMEDWQVVNSAMTSDAFCSDYCNHCENTVDPKSMWTTKNAKKCKKSMAVIAEMCSRGQLYD